MRKININDNNLISQFVVLSEFMSTSDCDCACEVSRIPIKIQIRQDGKENFEIKFR